MIRKLELVLRATLADDTVVEGEPLCREPGIIAIEDAHAFRALDAAIQSPPPAYDESLATVLLGFMKQICDSEMPDARTGVKPDLLDLCLRRLCEKLRERNDPEPA